jgi:hypothetical protein
MAVIGSFEGELPLLLVCLCLVVDDRSAVVGTILYMAFIGYLARVREDGEVKEHFPF